MKNSIKKLLICTIAIAMIMSLCINASASNKIQSESAIIHEEYIKRINEQLTDTETEAFKKINISHTETDGKTTFEYAIVRIFPDVFGSKVGENLETIIQHSNSKSNLNSRTNYIVFAEIPYRVSIPNNKQNAEVTSHPYTDITPTYVTDIAQLPKGIVINGQGCVVNSIYCADSITSHLGAVVYLQTDKGIYVNYYKNNNSKAVVFTEEEFRVKAFAYYEYITSYEYNYDENGHPKGGGNVDFLTFIGREAPPINTTPSTDNKPTDDTALSTESSKKPEEDSTANINHTAQTKLEEKNEGATTQTGDTEAPESVSTQQPISTEPNADEKSYNTAIVVGVAVLIALGAVLTTVAVKKKKL